MKQVVSNKLFSKTFLILVGIVYFFNFIYSDFLPGFLSLSPQEVIKDLTLWKLITFPFASSGTESYIFFALVFYFISSKLENYIEGFKYPLWLFLLTLLQGCMITLVFNNSNIIISGLDGISFYVLLVYSLLRPKDKINFLNFPSMPVIGFALMVGLLWFGLKIVNFSSSNDINTLIAALSSSIFGITAGFVHYLQIRLSGNNHNNNRNKQVDNDLKIPSPEELSLSHTSNARIRRFYQQQQNYNFSGDEITDILSEDMDENEEKLNEILDKISLLGTNSLTVFEKRFLNEYSKQL